MKPLLLVIGIVLLVAGIVFAGQGSGFFPYPASSFMVRQTQWISYGAVIAVVGIALIFFARR